MPKVPSLFSALTMGNDSTNVNIYGPQANAHVLESGEVVDLLVTNTLVLPAPCISLSFTLGIEANHFFFFQNFQRWQLSSLYVSRFLPSIAAELLTDMSFT